MKMMDCVEVIVEKDNYAKEGVHKGMNGWICDPRNIEGNWLVSFEGEIFQGEDGVWDCTDITIEVLEEDLKVIKESGMEQITNEDEIRKIVLEVLEENSEAAKDYNPEKGRMLDFFIGQTMKKSRGKANPEVATKVLKEELTKLK